MSEIKFNPKFILRNIIEIYTHLMGLEEFLECIVSDERSFDIKLFERTKSILEEKGLLSYDYLEKFSELFAKLTRLSDEKASRDSILNELTDIPDEF